MAKAQLIIDTDPGVDDAMAILAALSSQDLTVVGLTTIYGNCPTPLSTENALRLVELTGKVEIPVAEGSNCSLLGVEKEYTAAFVHGEDGFGNIHLPKPQLKPVAQSAAEFIVASVNARPAEVTILALGPLTNIALALQLDPSIGGKWAGLVILGGAFFVNGNVNPSAEANFFGDPAAADFVFASGAKNVRTVGLDVTHSCHLSGERLSSLATSHGPYGAFVTSISQVYLNYHREYYHKDQIFLHDPTALIAVIKPELFTWTSGSVVVVTNGPAKGHSIMDAGLKGWRGDNAWTVRTPVHVATSVVSFKVVEAFMQLLAH